MNGRERLIELINKRICATTIEVERIADYLIANGVIVLPPTTDEMVKKVAHMKYNEGKLVKEIAYEIGYCYRHTLRFLKKFKEIERG